MAQLGLSQNLIKLLSTPAGCVGGEVCLIQPSVGVFDYLGRVVVNFVGTAVAQMGASPLSGEPLYLGPCSFQGCGPKALTNSKGVPFVNGIASFAVSFFFVFY